LVIGQHGVKERKSVAIAALRITQQQPVLAKEVSGIEEDDINLLYLISAPDAI